MKIFNTIYGEVTFTPKTGGDVEVAVFIPCQGVARGSFTLTSKDRVALSDAETKIAVDGFTAADAEVIAGGMYDKCVESDQIRAQ
jgi:hypothetical protein